MKVLVSDPLGKAGMAVLAKDKNIKVDEKAGLKPDELKKIIGQYDGIIIRSGTKLTADIIEYAKKLRVIGRAGVGVDNVDLPAATKRGIIVMNTPGGNTISTAEHTFSMLMALSRNIPQAYQSVAGGEWKRQKFLGAELNRKVIGIIGFGRIGREVGKRAAAFGMKVVAFDPFISSAVQVDYPVEFAPLQSLFKQADYITVHTPLVPETKHIVDEKAFKLCKNGVRIINCARGGIVDEKALYQAIKSGKVAGAALDVFEQEPPVDNPLVSLPQVICTPHLGAATQEAQENVAVDVAYQVLDALHERAIKNAVNMPSLDPEAYNVLRPWLNLAEKIGLTYTQLFGGSLKSVNIRYGGVVTNHSLAPLTIALMKGLLTPMCGETVNYVNAQSIAKERGITVNENRSNQTEDFTNYIELEVPAGKETVILMGTILGNQLPRIVRINEYMIDVEPVGTVVFIKNEDQPGVVGKVGTILGKNKINIAEMSLGRVHKGKKVYAMTIINTDNDVSAKVIKEIKSFPPIIDVKVVNL
ncbi:MAG: phosphoglycerate dehydrogenase [Candidatus Omnitrophica bacterium]|nr:phosphoglycerate dehydrogenase [Candidatus Omnitrophota bacterium]